MRNSKVIGPGARLAMAVFGVVAMMWAGRAAEATKPTAPPREGVSWGIDALGWMTGYWVGTDGGMTSEEHWTGTGGGGLVGMHKDVKGNRMVSFEFLRIGIGPDGRVTYFSSPRGAPQTAFAVKDMGVTRVVFENLEHDFPQRILYWLDDEKRLHARIEGTMNGKPASEEWVWTRAGGATN
ncbi:MAG: DUF6265 family protein [Candidatus Eisenbacteria bacterium]|nr:DUF6265 family protein [Candidatus Eisenbacteria bacterium]